MTLSPYLQEVAKRRTFAIISHPDAGKTTITEKVLLFGQAIQTAGTVKGRGSSQHAKSDWMEMEKQRGISITTSVMQFPYHDCLVNLLDTPGHEDFSEDTYRTLTAVDCCLMVIDAAKGVEDRTRKLMEVTRLRDTPILTFMNKLDRDIRDPMELLDEVENELKIGCAPITWPIGCGKLFKGVYHLYKDETYLYQTGKGHTIQEVRIVKGLNNPDLDAAVGEDLAHLHALLVLTGNHAHKGHAVAVFRVHVGLNFKDKAGEGVSSVNDKLSVQNEKSASLKGYAGDTAVTSEIKAKLLADDIVPSRNVKVETTDGVVHLSGTVESSKQSERAEGIAKAVSGVKSVKNDLSVK